MEPRAKQTSWARCGRPLLLAVLAALLLPSSALAQAVLPGDEPNGEYPGYWSWPAIVEKIEGYQRNHPNLVRVQPIGKTYEGRDILVMTITNNVAQEDPEKPEILFLAGIHAREQQPQVMLMRFIDELITGYGSDARITRLLDTRALWVIPIYNVDGKVYDFQNGNGTTRGVNQRITRQPFPGNRFGVDLNRNNPVGWGSASNTPGSQTYHGPGPMSTPESQVLFNFMDSRNFVLFLDIHAAAEAYLMPGRMIREEQEIYRWLTRGQQIRQRGPWPGRVPSSEGEAGATQGTGSGQTHVTGLYIHGAYSYVWEVGPVGRARFYPTPEAIHQEYEDKVREPWFFLLEEAIHLQPKDRGDHFRVTNATLSGSPTPGSRVQWVPQVEGNVAYGVLISRSPAIRVTGDYRLYPITDQRGHTLNIREDAEPGTEVPLTLYLWDRERRQSVIEFTVRIEAGG